MYGTILAGKPFVLFGQRFTIRHFQLSWIYKEILFVRIQEQTTIIYLDFRSRFSTVQTAQIINVEVILEYLATDWPIIFSAEF